MKVNSRVYADRCEASVARTQHLKNHFQHFFRSHIRKLPLMAPPSHMPFLLYLQCKIIKINGQRSLDLCQKLERIEN